MLATLRCSFFLLLISGCAFFVAPPASAADLKCDLCRKTISGRYRVYEQGGSKINVCLDCDATRPHCALCNIPVDRHGARIGGETVCSSCKRNARVCSFCGHLIRSTYIVFEIDGRQTQVCAACEKDSIRCDACTRPMKHAEAAISGEHKLCPQCDAQLPPCTACGIKNLGARYFIRHQPGEFCESCWTQRPACSICGSPVGNTYSTLSDGRCLCSSCARTAVLDSARSEAIFKQVRKFLDRRLGEPLKTPVRLRLVGPEELELTHLKANESEDEDSPFTRRLHERVNAHSPGTQTGAPSQDSSADAAGKLLAVEMHTEHATVSKPGSAAKRMGQTRGLGEMELGKFIRRGNDFEILILSGMPESWVWETAAHEYAHAWQSEKNPGLRDLAWAEGFAQWVAELVLEERNDRVLLERLRGRTDFYGQAWCLIHQLEVNRGEKAVIPYIRALKK